MLWSDLDDIKMLIVEDDPFNRLLIKSLLEKVPQISFLEAADGVEALEILKQFKLDMLLLDLHMPNMNGHETLAAMKKNKSYNDIAVIAMTTDELEKREFYKQGADDFISKPFKLEELESKIYHNIKDKREDMSDGQEEHYETDSSSAPIINIENENKDKDTAYSITEIEIYQKEFFHKMIALKTKENSKHRRRAKVVATIAKGFALKLGYGKHDASNIFSATLIRDIGLIGLCGTLKEEEIFTQKDKKLHQKYILLGYQMISGMLDTNFSKTTKKIILQYNERYDGTGIPYKLSGEKISDEAMIVSIAETFEALLSDRSYLKRKKLSPEEAYKIIYSERGHKFSPRLIDIFLQHFNSFITIMKKDNNNSKKSLN
ncbi:MAG: response regulator [Campylobacterota bacterium]|nr:response regulator [Campylobacterota bacterium]